MKPKSAFVAWAAATMLVAAPVLADGPAAGSAGSQVKADGSTKKLIIGILDVRVDGVPPEAAARFEARLTEQLDTGHYWLATRARMRELLANSPDWTDGCVAGPCLSVVKTQTGAERVVSVYLHGKGTNFGSVVTLMRTDTGAVVKQHSEQCDACTVNEAVEQSILATIGLVGLAPDVLPDQEHEDQARLATALAPERAERRRVVRRQHRLGIGLAVTGLAVATAGILLKTQTNGNSDVAHALVGGGAGLTASGLLVWAF
jgi:hypothetical protein